MTNIRTIDERLQVLPAKVAMPFRQLLQADQLAEDAMEVILDAGELSGQQSILLGFAVAYLQLRGKGVPVHDVVSMAKTRGRRINLTWSAKRWQQEHERLSRLETLERLAEENVSYDVSGFEAHLPTCFSGYLIRNSRRLGMEGLRQRHCVAGYHSRLLASSCAIATVFADRKRWTVELVATGMDEGPLRIAQIKSRFNEPPCRKVRETIHDMLGITTASPSEPLTQADAQDRQYIGVLQCVLTMLREQGLQEIHVAFDGSGDTGAIDYITCTPNDQDEVLSLIVEHPTARREFEDGQWIRRVERSRQTVREALEELTYDYLEETDVDWYNNEGGYGELVIDVTQGTVQLDVNVRYVESTTEFHCEADILTGLEIG